MVNFKLLLLTMLQLSLELAIDLIELAFPVLQVSNDGKGEGVASNSHVECRHENALT
jgi:hypothetical protein